MEITKLTDSSFSVTTAVEKTYNVTELNNELRTLNARVAQEISNGQRLTKERIQPILEQIETVKNLLTEAGANGIDITPEEVILDASEIVARLDVADADAQAIASPKVIPNPVIEGML